MFDEIEAHGALPEEDTAVLIMNVLSCVNYCHQKNIVHRDLKPENILLTESKKPEDLKIIDFGLATYIEPMERLKDSVGSAYYKPPEVIKENYGAKCDIWSVGVICFILLGGYAPFDGDDDDEITDMIVEGEYDFDDPAWYTVSEDAKDFIEECLTYNEKHRPTAAEALTHPWLEKIRKATQKDFVRKESDSIVDSLKNMSTFHASSKMKQATLAFIASQLLLKEEKEAIDEVFRALDLNSDGKLTKDEIKIGYKEFYEKDLSNEEVETIFKRVNFRGTGAIDYSEFVVASMFEKNLLDDSRLEAAFKNFDKDGDGYISASNIKTVLSSLGDMEGDMDAYVNDVIIKEFDREGKGRISYEDFKYMMFETVEKPKKQRKRRSLMAAVGNAPLIEEETSSMPDKQKMKQRSGSIKDIMQSMSVMSMFDSAKEGTGPNPLFKKSKQRFASVRASVGSSTRKAVPRTTTREKISMSQKGASLSDSLHSSLKSGSCPFPPEMILGVGGDGRGNIEEGDDESD